jgi:hypothetical protein
MRTFKRGRPGGEDLHHPAADHRSAGGGIAELPFRRRDILDLLHLDTDREEPDPDYAGYGHGIAPVIGLASRRGGAQLVRDALVIAVHSADEPERPADDILLELAVPEVAAGHAVTVLLSDFLRVWLPRLRSDGDERRPIVLVVCNAHHARLARPPAARGVPLHYPLGEVESWIHFDGGQGSLRLVADAWCLLEDGGRELG